METSKNDIKNIIEGIKRFMPDFSVTKDDLLNIKSTFVISFYRRYLIELERNCKTIFDNDGDSEDVRDIILLRGTDDDMSLFLQIRYILSRIGVSYFTMCDFYRPSNRTRLTIKVCLNFLLYIQENLPKAEEIIQSFNDTLKKNQMRIGRILEKKREIGKLSSELGLYEEQLSKLHKEYDAEKNLQVTLLDTQVKLANEVKDSEKELHAVELHISSQTQKKNILDARIEELKNKVVVENYESQKEILDELTVKIQEHDQAIHQSEATLDEKHKELMSITEISALLQNTNISALEHVEKLDSLKQKQKELASALVKIQSIFEEKQAYLNMQNEDVVNKRKRQAVHEEDLKTSVSTMTSQYDRCYEQFRHEEELHKNSEKIASLLKEQIEARQKACSDKENQNFLIQTHIQNMYQQMLSSQNFITTPFKDLFSKFME